MTTIEAQLRELQDREAIRGVLHRYSRIIDAWDIDALRGCFAEDVEAVYNYNEISGIEQLLDYFRSYRFAPAVGVESLSSTSHFIGNMEIDLAGDEARSETYLLALNIAGDGKLHTRCNYYTDEWRRAEAGWLICRRHHKTNWVTVSDVRIDPDRRS
jgi:hypothetical protein